MQFNRQKTHSSADRSHWLFRSLLLMTFVKETSVTKWVEKLEENKVYAILSGFEPGETPGVGAFYNFFERLVSGDKEQKRKQRNRRKKLGRKSKKKLKKNEKLPPKHPNIVNKVVKRIMRNFDHAAPHLGQYRLIHQFFHLLCRETIR